MSDLERDLSALLNRHSQEGASDTPDFILAKYLLDCLVAYNAAQVRRAEWYSKPRELTPTLEDLRLSGTVSVRVMRVFESLGIKTLEDLCATKPSTLHRAKNFGPSSYREVVLALSRIGRSLTPETSPSKCICRNGVRLSCPEHGTAVKQMLTETEERHRRAYGDGGPTP